MVYHNMSDSENEEPVKIVVKDLDEEEIFKKPVKAKRTLSDKQKQALAEGRRKAKAKRDAKLQEEADKKARAKVKKEQRDIEKAKAIEVKGKSDKKDKLKSQDLAREKVRQMEYSRKLKKYNDIKSAVLANSQTVAQYDSLTKILNGITEEDIMDENRMKKKLHSYINYSKDYLTKRQAR